MPTSSVTYLIWPAASRTLPSPSRRRLAVTVTAPRTPRARPHMSLLMSRSLSRAPPPAPHCRRPRPASGCPVGARCGVRRPALRPRRSVETVSARARARRPGSCAQPYEAQLGGLGGLCGGGRPKLAQAKIAGDHPIVPTARRKSGTSPRRDPASGDVASAFPASRRSYKSTRRRGPESGSVVLARPPSTSSIRRRWPPPAIVSAGSGVCAVAHGRRPAGSFFVALHHQATFPGAEAPVLTPPKMHLVLRAEVDSRGDGWVDVYAPSSSGLGLRGLWLELQACMPVTHDSMTSPQACSEVVTISVKLAAPCGA